MKALLVLALFLSFPAMLQEVVTALRHPTGGGVWTHIQGGSDFTHSATINTFCRPSLGSAPAVGNVVWVAAILYAPTSTPPGSVAVTDGNANSYTLTPSSPQLYNPTVSPGFFWIYLARFIASGLPSASLNVGWTGSFRSDCWADEFHKSSGSITFDTDAFNALSVCSGTSAGTPTLTPSTSPELLYGAGFDFDNSLVAPTAGGTLGSWTGTTGGPEASSLGVNSEYDLNATSATAANYTCGGSGDQYGAMIGAVK